LCALFIVTKKVTGTFYIIKIDEMNQYKTPGDTWI